jgi:anthraniloyl-CoA monooxygenase
MEDAISLVEGLSSQDSIKKAIEYYENQRRPEVASLQRAAQVSLEWFEDTERYFKHLEPVQFGMSLLTRSLRITHENLKVRDPDYVANVDRRFAVNAFENIGEGLPEAVPPPMFTPYQLRGMRLENRVVVSPMCQYCAVDGTPNDWHLVHLGSRAIGGAGLIITEMTHISSDARITPGCTGLYSAEHLSAWKKITDFIHQESPAKVGIQLGHAGRKGSTKKMWEGMDEPLEQGNWPVKSASPLSYYPNNQVPEALTEADMGKVTSDFVRSTKMAQEAGFDLLELHMAHGYLLASFISPLTNQRADSFGGSLENRMRFPLQVFDAVRAAWPDDRPISVRISATDWIDGGTTGEDSVEIARMLKERGCDIIDVSTGQTSPEQSPRLGRLYQTPHSERIRLEAQIPTMTVGGVSSFEDVNSILTAGRADLCVLARAHLYDPYWTRHAAYELGYKLEWPPQYETVGKGYSFRFK